MKKEIPSQTTDGTDRWNPWIQHDSGAEHRAETPLQALLQCAPGDEPELSVQELREIREVLVDAMELLLTEEEMWVFNSTVIARTSLRKMGIPKTSSARIRDNAITKLKNHLKEHPVIVAYLERHNPTHVQLLHGLKVYLAGPMRNQPEFGHPQFAQARMWLRERGIEVVCPAENNTNNGFDTRFLKGTPQEMVDHGIDVDEAIANGVTHVLSCGAVVALPGWQASQGARIEMAVAFKYNKPVYTFQPPDRLAEKVIRRTNSSGGVWEVIPL